MQRRRRAARQHAPPTARTGRPSARPQLRLDERAEEPERLALVTTARAAALMRAPPRGTPPAARSPPGAQPIASTRTPSGPGTSFRLAAGPTRSIVPGVGLDALAGDCELGRALRARRRPPPGRRARGRARGSRRSRPAGRAPAARTTRTPSSSPASLTAPWLIDGSSSIRLTVNMSIEPPSLDAAEDPRPSRRRGRGNPRILGFSRRARSRLRCGAWQCASANGTAAASGSRRSRRPVSTRTRRSARRSPSCGGRLASSAGAGRVPTPTARVATSGIAEFDLWPTLPRLIALEEHGDVTSKPQLVVGRRASVALSAATGGDLARSRRWRECLAPYGVGDELMTVCRDRHGCWGSVELMRDTDDPPFDERRRAAPARARAHARRAAAPEPAAGLADRAPEQDRWLPRR